MAAVRLQANQVDDLGALVPIYLRTPEGKVSSPEADHEA